MYFPERLMTIFTIYSCLLQHPAEKTTLMCRTSRMFLFEDSVIKRINDVIWFSARKTLSTSEYNFNLPKLFS